MISDTEEYNESKTPSTSWLSDNNNYEIDENIYNFLIFRREGKLG
jgi:hypothetical protein